MTRLSKLILIGAVGAVVLSTAPMVFAATEIEGQGDCGAYYRIMVPDNWNDDLVIWNHGFSLSEPGPVDDLGPLVDLQLLEGYAVAASSYRQKGWALFKSNQDLRELVRIFTAEFGAPRHILLYGASLGGAVTAAAVEKGRLGNVVGALTLCGAVAGSRNWDVALDLRLLYDLVCEGMPGAAIPGGAKGLPRDSDLTDQDIEDAVNACTGINESRSDRTRQQQENLQTILDLTGMPKSFLVTDMLFATEAMADLVDDRTKLRGKLGTGNEHVVYGDPYVDAQIERVSPRPAKARKLERNFSPSGRVGGTKIVSMHTSKDGLVLVENESVFRDRVPASNLTIAIVDEKRASHCAFAPGEVVAAWEGLRDWIVTGEQPAALDLQQTCEAIPGLGEVCRIDPDFVLPDADIRMRPRNHN